MKPKSHRPECRVEGLASLSSLRAEPGAVNFNVSGRGVRKSSSVPISPCIIVVLVERKEAKCVGAGGVGSVRSTKVSSFRPYEFTLDFWSVGQRWILATYFRYGSSNEGQST